MGINIDIIRNCTVSDEQDLSDIISDGLRNLVDDYFSSYFDPIEVYFASNSEGRHGTVIVNSTDFGPIYMDKFVVRKDRQSNGTGKHLAQAVRNNYDKGFCRVSKDNPANKFYENAFGLLNRAETSKWYVYHWGLTRDEITKALDYARNLPETLKPKA